MASEDSATVIWIQNHIQSPDREVPEASSIYTMDSIKSRGPGVPGGCAGSPVGSIVELVLDQVLQALTLGLRPLGSRPHAGVRPLLL